MQVHVMKSENAINVFECLMIDQMSMDIFLAIHLGIVPQVAAIVPNIVIH